MADTKIEKNKSSNESTPKKSAPIQATGKDNHTVLDSLQELAENSLNTLQDSGSESDSKDKYIPGPFPKEGKSLADIKQNLLTIISHCEAEDQDELLLSSMKPRKWMDSEVQKAALLSHTMAAYISTLNKSLVRRIAMQLVSDTNLWLSEIFSFQDSLAFFSKDSKEGLIRMIRKALLSKYRRYSNAGYEVLFTRPPVIYYCDLQGQGIGKHVSYLCSQLGLPLSSATLVPCLSSSADGKYKMDPDVLEKYIKDDISATKTPLVVLANAGFPVLGHMDNLQRIYEICTAHDVWLHVHGHLLAGLSLLSTSKVPSIYGDSLSLSLGKWIGLPSLPYITLYRGKDMAHTHEAGLDQAFQGHLDFLPVWVTIQSLGQESLKQKIQLCFKLGGKLLECIENCPELRIVSKRKISSKDNLNLDPSTASITELFDSLTPVIVFQYTSTDIKEKDVVEPNPPYFDNLNSWLIQLLSREVPNIKTDILDLEEYGLCLRICPLENANVLGTTEEDIDQYYCCLKQQITILSATARQREKLYTEYKNNKKLQLVDIVDWAGMGAVRYIPEFWADRLNELTDTGKADINQLNSEIVAKLKASDSAFSVGETEDGMICVRFGMVDDNLDLEELIGLVTTAGEELEESSKFLETMSEMVKHGIEEANKELIQENQEKLMQEGILRQVPVIGSLVSWWYPTSNESGIKGRSFNLSSGTVESTENIYKYHMQIKEASKSPPTTAKVIVPSNSSQTSVSADQNSNTPATS